jgi:pheromone shutdown protein TraB
MALSGCPVKKGEQCPYPDKKSCPHRAKEARPAQVSKAHHEKTVYLLGTVHVSQESARKVEDTIRTVLPGMVCMELDIQRFRVLQQMIEEQKQREQGYVEIKGERRRERPEKGQLGAEDRGLKTEDRQGEGGHFRYSARAGGKKSAAESNRAGIKDMFTMPGMLKWLQQQIGEELGVMPGSEMASAYETARRYGLDIGLIDRPVDITISRMWGGMKFKEKVRLVGMLMAASSIFLLKPVLGKKTGGLMSMLGETKELDIKKLEKGEGIDELMGELEKQFPAVHRALVDERNVHMANNILHILKEKADTIVVVVGAGHVAGMKKLLEGRGVKVVI